MESDKESLQTATSDEEFCDLDEAEEENCVHHLEDALSNDGEEKLRAVFNKESPSAPGVKPSLSEQQFDLITPVASETSLDVCFPSKADIKADTSIFFDQAQRESFYRQRAGSRMKTRSKLCQTEWNWEEDLKLLNLHSENSFFSNLLSEMTGTEVKSNVTKDLEGESDKSPFRAKLFGTGLEAGEEDILLIGWEKEMDAQMESSNEDWMMSFVKTLPSVGPPQILQYKKESAFHNATCPPYQKQQTTTAYDALDEELLNYIFQLDKAALRAIVTQDFMAICPFCGKEASVHPFCCDAYRNYIEMEMLQKGELNEYRTGKFSLDSKSELLRGNQKLSKGEFGAEDHSRLRWRSTTKKKHFADQTFGSQQSLKQSKSSKEKRSGLHTKDKDQGKGKVAKDQSSSGLTRKISQSMVKDAITRSQTFAPGRSLVPTTSLYQQGGRQLKTISYQLSSKKCLEDGWTLRFSPSLARSELIEDYNDLIQIGRLNGSNSLFVRTYNNGNIFAVIFPDGSGTIFHPNGRVAISVVLVGEGLYTYIIQDDSDESKVLAVFQPDGHACVYFPDGRLRISLSPIGGLEISHRGAKKRKWLWHDMYDQQQRAPLQPITIGVMPECGIRIMSQANIGVTYINDCRNIRLHVGTTLKLSSQFRQATPKNLYDQDELFRHEKQLRIGTLINQILTVLEFPKSPKLDNIPVPLHLLNSNHQKKYPRSQLTA